MSSLEELFCHIDDFCQKFEPLWQQQLLGQGVKTRRRARGRSPERNHDHLGSVPPASLPHIQTLLPRTSMSLLEQRLSRISQLLALCRMDAFGFSASVCLFEALLWPMYRHQLY